MYKEVQTGLIWAKRWSSTFSYHPSQYPSPHWDASSLPLEPSVPAHHDSESPSLSLHTSPQHFLAVIPLNQLPDSNGSITLQKQYVVQSKGVFLEHILRPHRDRSFEGCKGRWGPVPRHCLLIGEVEHFNVVLNPCNKIII